MLELDSYKNTIIKCERITLIFNSLHNRTNNVIKYSYACSQMHQLPLVCASVIEIPSQNCVTILELYTCNNGTIVLVFNYFLIFACIYMIDLYAALHPEEGSFESKR